jgi:hypothetical protein
MGSSPGAAQLARLVLLAQCAVERGDLDTERLDLSNKDHLQIVKRVLDAGATIRVLDFPSLDLTTPEGRGFLALFSAMAERERMRIRLRIWRGRPPWGTVQALAPAGR